MTKLGIAVIVMACAYTGAAAYATGQPVAEQRVATTIPDLTSADHKAVRDALGSTPADASARTRGMASDLTVPEGSTGYREGLWHLGKQKWGMVRVYDYATPIDVATRTWRTSRVLKGASAAKTQTDTFGVRGLREVSVYIDTKKSRVVSVQPTDYDELTDVSFTPNAPGEEEMGE